LVQNQGNVIDCLVANMSYIITTRTRSTILHSASIWQWLYFGAIDG